MLLVAVKKKLQGTSLYTCSMVYSYKFLRVNLIHFNQNTSIYKRLYQFILPATLCKNDTFSDIPTFLTWQVFATLAILVLFPWLLLKMSVFSFMYRPLVLTCNFLFIICMYSFVIFLTYFGKFFILKISTLFLSHTCRKYFQKFCLHYSYFF